LAPSTVFPGTVTDPVRRSRTSRHRTPAPRSGFASRPSEGLAPLTPLLTGARVERYQPLHAAHAELLRRAGDRSGAGRAYARTIALSTNAVERAELQRRRATLNQI